MRDVTAGDDEGNDARRDVQREIIHIPGNTRADLSRSYCSKVVSYRHQHPA